MRKAALYARFSSNNQRDESIDAQERAIRKYAEENIDREEFQRMLNDSRYGLFDLVTVHKLDRFARNRYDSAVSRKILRDNGVELYSVIEKFDNTPESIILEGLMETLNEYYSANLSREVMKGMRENALRLLADILFDKDRLPAVIEEYNRAVTQAESSVESDRKRLKKSIKSLENEVGNIISVIARTGSESLTAALDRLNRTYPEALKIIRKADRKEVVSASGE